MRLRWARSATRHRISRERSAYVIERCGLRFDQEPPEESPERTSPRLVFLGDDRDGVALEVMAIELEGGDLLVIHAMALRARYAKQYEEARKWRR